MCKHDDPRVTVRTDYVLYLRCEHCAAVWSVPKPGRDPFGLSERGRTVYVYGAEALAALPGRIFDVHLLDIAEKNNFIDEVAQITKALSP